jgi:3-oxo-5-alpha-steroid 4-dehydrogenase 1
MAIVEGWLPPTQEHYDLILKIWQISYPIVSGTARAPAPHMF